MQDDIGLNRQISIMLVLNALTGFLYTSLPNTYIVKQNAYPISLIGMAALAALISYFIWQYGKSHAKQQAKYQAQNSPESLWENSLKWLLPLCFIPLFAVVGTRALIVLWAYQGEIGYSEAKITAHAPAAQSNWWTLAFNAPFQQDITLAVNPYLLEQFRQGDRIRIQYRETPLAFNFTSINHYWQVEKINAR